MAELSCEVLVVGAGPTGLMLANWLTRLGVQVIVADGKARVAQGTIVAHYGSAWRPAELAALRPNYADLKPRARTNQE